MELKFRVAARIAKPVHEVFEAVADPEQLSHYFTTGGAKGRLETGATVTWDFHDYPGAFPVQVIEVVPDQRIVYTYTLAVDGTRVSVSLVTVEFTPDAGGTRLTYTEQGAFLDGHDTPAEREHGTREGLARLDEVLPGAPAAELPV